MLPMKTSHLSDDRLVEIGLTETPSGLEQQHLGACPPCETRRAGIAHMLGQLSQAAIEDADAAFPADLRARQQVRILQRLGQEGRLEQEGRPAKVIAFPAGHTPDSVLARSRPATRWIAAAAVAGLVVGLAAGRFGQQGPRGFEAPQAASRPSAAPFVGESQFRAVTATISDDELLGQIELAVDGRGGASLRPLDELTPRAWDVR